MVKTLRKTPGRSSPQGSSKSSPKSSGKTAVQIIRLMGGNSHYTAGWFGPPPKAIGPLQLTEEEARTTARRAYENNPRLTSFEIGQAIGRSRQTVDAYIADLRASFQMDLDLKILRMNGLQIPQERMANRLGVLQQTISIHLQKMPELAKLVNTDLSKGFTVVQVAEKHGWTEPMVWSLSLEGKDDLERFKELNWGLRTWDLWNWNDCDFCAGTPKCQKEHTDGTYQRRLARFSKHTCKK